MKTLAKSLATYSKPLKGPDIAKQAMATARERISR